MECTCSIRYIEDGGEPRKELAQIDFCPMHSAARDMLEALKSFPWMKDNFVVLPANSSHAHSMRLAIKAVAKAEGV